jgi:type IV secretion system protein VirD4
MPPDLITSSDSLSYDPDSPGSKILLGAIGGRLVGIDDNRHMMTVAGSRTGKGVSAIIPNLIFYKGSVLVIDPKAELANITARRRAEGMGQQVYVLDPFNRAAPWVEEYKASYNPLSILKPDSPTLVEDAGLISDALVIAGGNDPHWDDSARNFIEGIVLHVATYPAYEGRRNLVTVRRLLMSGSTVALGDQEATGMDGLQVEMLHNVELLSDSGGGEALEAAAADFFDKPDNERMSVLSTSRRHTKFLDFPNLQTVLTGHDFDLTALKTAPGGMTVYLCLPAARLATCSRWFRLFVNLALEAMEREQSVPPIPVLLCLDEFAALGHMRQIETAAGQIAGLGVKLWPILQDLTQLKRDYKEGWETFLGNAGVIQFFGNNDMTTLDFISKRLGKTAIRMKKEADTTHEQRSKGASGESWAVELYDLLTAEEASRYFGRDDPQRRQLIIWAGQPPMVLQRLVYHADPIFEEKYEAMG